MTLWRYNSKELCGQNRDQCDIVTQTISSMTEIYLDSSDPACIPVWIKIGASETDKRLIMCPEHRRFTTAIPALLLHKEYTNCKPIFLLDSVPGRTECWKVLGEITAFGADLVSLIQHGPLRRSQLLMG